MKNINTYINEKLIVNNTIQDNKKTNPNFIIYDIYEYLGLEYYEMNFMRFYDLVKQWKYFENCFDKNSAQNSNDLEPCADLETLNASHAKKEYKKAFNTDPKRNEECLDELSKTKRLYANNIDNYEIKISDKMICNICDWGTLYVIIKDKF